MNDDSSDLLRVAGVRRLNKRPILIAASIGLSVALSLIYAINRRAAATQAPSPESLPPAEQNHAVVDSSAVVAELTRDLPTAGVIPEAGTAVATPTRPPAIATAAAAVNATMTPPGTATDVALPGTPLGNGLVSVTPLSATNPGPVGSSPASALNRARISPEDEARNRQANAQQRRLQVYEAALTAPTRVNFLSGAPGEQPTPSATAPASMLGALGGARPDPTAAALQLAALQAAQGTSTDPNLQDSKIAFSEKERREGYLPTTRTPPLSPYEVKMGTLFPAIMVSGVNSDLPGYLIAQISQNVYDSATGRHLLIPQGAKLFGRYDSRVSYGQNRVLVTWTRLTYPDGSSLDLGGMTGADQAGYSGFADRVNNHYLKIFGSALLMSAISAGVQVSQPDPAIGSTPTPGQEIAGAVGQEFGRASAMILQKNINIQPTLEIRPGYRFNVIVNQDIAFAQAYAAR